MQLARTLVVLTALIGTSVAIAQDESLKKITTVEGITEYHMPNGMKVLLFPDDSKPRVTINITYFVGSRHEGYGEAGMAHLLEHMAFKGTPTFKDVPKELIGRGAQPMNGTTWLDRTNYYEGLPATPENLEFGIKFEADRMMNSYIAEKDLKSEMTVVRNEFESGENSPSRILMQRMMGAAYEWHNYGKSTIGNRADIERVPIKNLQAFYKKYYQPDNALLIVAGKFDEAKAKEHIVQYFGSIPKPTRELPQTYTEEPAQDGERLVTLRRVGTVGWGGALYHVPSGAHPEAAAIAVLNRVLGSEPGGRLYKKLVQTKRASAIQGTHFSLHDPGVMFYLAQAAAGSEPETVLEAVLSVTEGFADSPVTQEEIDRVKQQFVARRKRALANTSQLAIELSEWAAQGDWRLYFLFRDQMEKVTQEQVQAAATKYLVRNNRTAGLYIPSETSERISVPATPDIAKMLDGYKGRAVVSKGEVFDSALANIESRTQRSELPGGIKVALLPKENRGDTVSMRLTLRYGDKTTLNGRDKAGDFLPQMLMRGTEEMNRQEVQDAFSKLGAQVSIQGQSSVIAVSVQAERDKLAGVLDLLKKVLREPAFPDEEVETMKTQQIAGFEQQKSDPQALAASSFMRKMNPYKKGDPRYRPTMDEEIERTKKVNGSDIRNLYIDLLNGAHGELTVVGDFDPAMVVEKVNAICEGWSSDTKYVRMERLGNFDLKGGLEVIETPDKANAMLIGGMSLPLGMDHPDYAAMVIGNRILGGDPFTSRLGARIRQKDGLSYGVGSQMSASPYDTTASLIIFAISAPQNGAKLRMAINEEIAKLLKDGVNQTELENAVKGYLDGQKNSRTSDAALAGLLEQTSRTGRSLQFTAAIEAKIKALTPEQVNAALRKHIDPAKLNVVHAGDFEKK
jgi:zinc protease